MKEITESQVKAAINSLCKEAKMENANINNIICKAVGLGMAYQERKIKEGIEIVFDELHNKNKKI